MKKEPLSLQALRQNAAQIVACAICDLYPDTQLVETAANDTGFYCDVIFKRPLHEGIIPQVEERVRDLVTQDIPIRGLTMMRQNVVELFRHRKQPVLAKWIAEEPQELIDIFQMGEFYQACPPPFIGSSKEVSAIKIFEIQAGVIRFSPIGELEVTRLTGTAFPDKMQLKHFLKRVDSAKKRDPQVLLQEMDLAQFDGIGGHAWLPRGNALCEALRDQWLAGLGLETVSTPALVDIELLEKGGIGKKSGELEGLFPPLEIEGVEYCLRPGFAYRHAELFLQRHPVRGDLPLRFAEWGQVYRQLDQPQQCGFLRCPVYTQEMTHIFCTAEQAGEELISSLQFIGKIIRMFDFKPAWYLCSRQSQRKGLAELWSKGETWLANALEQGKYAYEKRQEGAEVGPAIEVYVADALGREWLVATLGLDFALAKGLELRCADSQEMPIVIARSAIYSVERLVALALEHYEGDLPFEMLPEQVKVLPIDSEQSAWAAKVQQTLVEKGLKVTLDTQFGKTLSERVKATERQRIPYVILIGKKETEECAVSLRVFPQRESQQGMKFEEVIAQIKEERLRPLES